MGSIRLGAGALLVTLLTAFFLRATPVAGAGPSEDETISQCLTAFSGLTGCAPALKPESYRHLLYAAVAKCAGRDTLQVLRACTPESLQPAVDTELVSLLAPADGTTEDRGSASRNASLTSAPVGLVVAACPTNWSLAEAAAAPEVAFGRVAAVPPAALAAAAALSPAHRRRGLQSQSQLRPGLIIQPVANFEAMPAGSLMELDALLSLDVAFGWVDVLMPLRHKLSASHNVAPVVPLDGTALMLVARQDVLAAMGEQAPPATWSDLALLTERYAARRPPGAPQSALCSTPGPRCDGSELFTAIWHSIAQTRGVRQGLYFDAGTMRPMADSAAFAAAAALFARLTRLSVPPPEQQQPRGGLSSADGAGAGGCSYAHAGLRAGLCAMAVGSLELIKDVARGGGSSSVGGASNASAPAFIVVPLPGSAYVQDPTDPSRLAPCTPELCPYGEAGAARLGSQQALAVDTAALSAAAAAASGSGKQGAAELGAEAAAALAAVEMPAAAPAVCLINRAPYVPSSLLAAGVSGRIPTSEQTLAWDALTYLAGTHGSLRLMLAPGSGVGPFRNSHFGSAARAAWAAAGYEPVLAGAGLDAAQAALMHANLAWGLNMMGGEFYRSALSSFLANTSMATTAFPAAANTTAAVLLAEARALQHQLEEHYSPAAAYASYYSAFLTLSDVVAPAPPSADGARSSGGGSSSRAVALAVALVVAALGLLAGGVFLAKRYGCGFGTGPCRRRQRLSWRSDAPGASPRTTLLITDIEGSTQLWEELPELLMNEALRIHHTTLRRVLVRHRGYESATEGDSFVLAFFDPHSALAFALEAQQELLEQDWPAELLAKQGCAPMYTTVPAGFPLRRHQNTVLSRMTYSMRPYTGGGGSAAATPLPGGNACSTPNTPQMAGQSVLARLASLGRDRSLLDRSVGNAGDVPPPLRPAASMAQSPTLGRRLRNMSTGGRQRASIDFGVLQAFTSKRGFDVGAPVAAAAGAASAAATGSKSSPNNVLAAALVADDGAPPVDIFAMTASPVVPPSPSAVAAAALALVQSPHGSPRHSPRQDPAGLRRDYSLDTSSQQHMSAQQHTTQASGSDLMRGHAEMFTDGGGGFDTQALTQTQDAMEDGRALTWRSSVNNLSTAASASAGVITGLLATAEADAGAVVDADLKAAASAALSGGRDAGAADATATEGAHADSRLESAGGSMPLSKLRLEPALRRQASTETPQSRQSTSAAATPRRPGALALQLAQLAQASASLLLSSSTRQQQQQQQQHAYPQTSRSSHPQLQSQSEHQRSQLQQVSAVSQDSHAERTSAGSRRLQLPLQSQLLQPPPAAVAFEFTDQPPLPPLHMPGRPAASGHAPPDDKATLKTASTAGGCGADTATAGSSPADRMGLWLRPSPSRPSAERPTGPASTTAYTAHTGSTASAWAVIHSGEAQHFLAEPSAVSPGLGHVLNHGEATAGGGPTTTGAELTAAAAAEAAELQAGGTPAFPSRNGTANGMLTPAAAGYGGGTPGGGGGLLSAAALAANEPLLKLWASRGGGSRAGRRSRGGMITPSHGVSPGPAHSAFTSPDRYRTGPGMLQASAAAAAAAPWEVCTLESALQAAMRAFDEGTIGDRKRRLLWRGLRVRMGLHSGVASEAEVTHNRASARTVYSGEGAAVVRAVADSAQGGMVLLSEAAVDAIDAGGGLHGTAANDALLVSLGRYRIRHRDRVISLFLAASPDLAPRAALLPPPRNVTPLGLTLHHAPVGRAALAGLSLPDVAALTEWDAAATAAALGVVERVAAEQLAAHRGYLVRRDRDTGALLAAFAFPLDAVRWALHCREALAAPELEWPAGLLEHEACREGVLVNGGVNLAGPVAAAAAAAAVGAASNGGGGGATLSGSLFAALGTLGHSARHTNGGGVAGSHGGDAPSGGGPRSAATGGLAHSGSYGLLPSPLMSVAGRSGAARPSTELARALTAACDSQSPWAAPLAAPVVPSGSRSVGVGISGGGAGGSGCGYRAHPVAAGGSGTGAGFATTSLATGDSLIVPLPIDTPRAPASVGAGGGGHSGCVGSSSATGMLGTAFSSRHSQRPSSARPSTSAELDSGQAALAAAAAAAMLTGATSAGSTMHGPLGGQASSAGGTALPWVSAAGTGANGAAAATGAAGGAAVLGPPWALRTSGASSGGRPSMAANSRTWGSTSRPAAAPCGCGGSGDEGHGSGPVNALHGGQSGNSRLSLQVISTGDARSGQGGDSAGGSTARAAGASNYVSSPCGGPGNGSSPGTTDAAAVAAATAIATTSAAEEGGATPGTSPPDGSGRTLRAARLSLRSAFGDKVAALSSRWRATANSYFEVGTGMGSAVRASMAASGGGAGTSGCVLPDAAGSARMADQQTTLTDSAAANALFGINASEAGGGIGVVGGAGSLALGRQAGSSAGYHMCTLSVMLPLPPPPPTATALPSSTGTTPTTAIPGVGGGSGHGTGGPGTGTATATGGYSRVFAPGATAGAGVSPREATMPGSAGGALASSAAAAAAGGGGGDGRTPKGLTVKTIGPAEWQSAEADGDGGDMFFEHLGGMDGLGPFGRAGGASTSGAFAMFGGGNGGGGGPAPGPSPPLLGDYGTGLNETVVLRGPRIRVGIDCGPVDWSVSPASHTLVYTGAPATTAEKLAAAAVPGQVLATYDVMCELHRMQATLVAQRTEFGMDTAGFGGGLGGGGGGLGLGAFESLAEDGAMDSPGTGSPGTAAIAAGTSGAGGAFGYRGGGGSTSLRGPAVVGVMLQPAAGRAARHRRHLVFSCRFTYDWTEALQEHDALLSRQPTGLLSAGGAGAGAGGGGIGVSGAYASAGATTGGSPHHTAAHSAALAAATPVGTPGRFSPFSSPWNWSTARLTRKRVTSAAPSASATAAAAAAAAADRGRLSLDSRGSFDVGGVTYTFGGPASGGGAANSTPLSSLQTAHAAAARLQQQQQWQSYAASARQAGLGGSASFAYGSSARSHAPGAGGAYYPPGALMPTTSNAAAAAAAAAGGLAAPSASPTLSSRGMATDGAGFGLRRGSPATGRAPNGIAAGGAMGTAAAHGRQLPGPAACSGGSGVDGQSRLAWQTHLPPSSWAALQAAAQAQRHHQQRDGGGIALSAPCNIVTTAYNPSPLQLQPPALQPLPVHQQSIHSSTIMLPSGRPSSNQTSTPLPAATASAPSADAGNGAAQFIPCAYAPTAAYSQQLARNGSGALPAALHQQEYLTAPSPSAVLTARVSASPPGSGSPRGALSAGSGATSTPLAMPPPLSRTGGSGGVAAAGTPTLPVHPRWLVPNHSLHNINHHHGGGGGSGSPPNQQYGNFALMRLARTKSGDPDMLAAAAAAAGASGSFGQGYYGFGGAAAGGGNAGDSASLRHNLQHAGTSHSLMSGSISLNANAFASSLSFGAVGLGGGGGGGSIGYMAGGGAAGARELTELGALEEVDEEEAGTGTLSQMTSPRVGAPQQHRSSPTGRPSLSPHLQPPASRFSALQARWGAELEGASSTPSTPAVPPGSSPASHGVTSLHSGPGAGQASLLATAAAARQSPRPPSGVAPSGASEFSSGVVGLLKPITQEPPAAGAHGSLPPLPLLLQSPSHARSSTSRSSLGSVVAVQSQADHPGPNAGSGAGAALASGAAPAVVDDRLGGLIWSAGAGATVTSGSGGRGANGAGGDVMAASPSRPSSAVASPTAAAVAAAAAAAALASGLGAPGDWGSDEKLHQALWQHQQQQARRNMLAHQQSDSPKDGSPGAQGAPAVAAGWVAGQRRATSLESATGQAASAGESQRGHLGVTPTASTRSAWLELDVGGSTQGHGQGLTRGSGGGGGGSGWHAEVANAAAQQYGGRGGAAGSNLNSAPARAEELNPAVAASRIAAVAASSLFAPAIGAVQATRQAATNDGNVMAAPAAAAAAPANQQPGPTDQGDAGLWVATSAGSAAGAGSGVFLAAASSGSSAATVGSGFTSAAVHAGSTRLGANAPRPKPGVSARRHPRASGDGAALPPVAEGSPGRPMSAAPLPAGLDDDLELGGTFEVMRRPPMIDGIYSSPRAFGSGANHALLSSAGGAGGSLSLFGHEAGADSGTGLGSFGASGQMWLLGSGKGTGGRNGTGGGGSGGNGNGSAVWGLAGGGAAVPAPLGAHELHPHHGPTGPPRSSDPSLPSAQ